MSTSDLIFYLARYKKPPMKFLRMSEPYLHISIPQQSLEWRVGPRVLCRYAVSTAANGPGEVIGSHCTPRGWHIIRAKIGAGAPLGAVFVQRRPTGEIWTPALRAQFPTRDWILTRILWLSGLEPGYNRLGQVDTFRRFIYIHGTPDDVSMGTPGSRGCVRMRNADLSTLYTQITAGTRVYITD